MNERLKAEDQRRNEAFHELIVPELEVTLRVARSLTGNQADAEDLVQDTLLRAYKALDRFDGRYPRAWLLTILRNTHLNRVRKKQPVLFRDDDESAEALASIPADDPGPEQEVLDATIDHRIAAAFRSLSPKFRDVVQLVDIDGLSYREAAQMLDIKLGTVMSRLHRARAKMKESLEKAGYLRGRTNP
jgi:RNA polymerase sigma-70 factor (ECF subfamily)